VSKRERERASTGLGRRMGGEGGRKEEKREMHRWFISLEGDALSELARTRADLTLPSSQAGGLSPFSFK
jgi:hypothetical protein